MTKSDSVSENNIYPELLGIIACPRCKGELELQPDSHSLDCRRCKLRYPIKEGLPILLVEEAQPI